jgi:hypothetical protein
VSAHRWERTLTRWASARGFAVEWVAVASHAAAHFLDTRSNPSVEVKPGNNEGMIVSLSVRGFGVARMKVIVDDDEAARLAVAALRALRGSPQSARAERQWP